MFRRNLFPSTIWENSDLPREQRQQVFPQIWQLHKKLQGVISHKTIILISISWSYMLWKYCSLPQFFTDLIKLCFVKKYLLFYNKYFVNFNFNFTDLITFCFVTQYLLIYNKHFVTKQNVYYKITNKLSSALLFFVFFNLHVNMTCLSPNLSTFKSLADRQLS